MLSERGRDTVYTGNDFKKNKVEFYQTTNRNITKEEYININNNKIS